MTHDPKNPVSVWLAKIGRRGGKKMTEAKRLANIARAKLPRKKK
jgi:hypothetical protein